MTKTNTLAAKLSVAFVATAMVFTMFAPATQAQSVEDLQAQIAALMAQINQLTSQVAGGGSMSSSSVCPYTWTRTLNMGATGADVMKLQEFLNSSADTQVAAAGNAGGPGMETSYYGPATGAAVAKFQEKYRMDILSPLGLVNATTFFGNSTMAKANALCVAAPATDGGDEDDDATDEDEDDSSESVDLSGEANLEDFEVEDADDTEVQEGDSDVEIGEFRVEFENGDAEIDRIDLALLRDTQTFTNGDADTLVGEPWETFETVSLWVDGDMIAEVDASDEDDYLDEDNGTLRFSGLELIAEEDEEIIITVGASIQNNLDSAELGFWELFATGMRFFDADGVSSDVNSDFDIESALAASNAVALFEIEVEGEGEELNFSLGSNNPDATDIIVDADSTTNDVTVMEYTIEAEEGDIELNTLFVNVVITGDVYADVVNDIELVIDGQTFRDEAVVTTGGSYSTSNVRVEFDIDGDIVIDEDDEVTAEVVVDFKRQDTNYANGTLIRAQVSSVERDLTDAEGADDVTEFSGTSIGEDHTLVAEGIVLPVDSVETSTDTQGDNDQTGVFSIDFDVTAVEGDFYITDDVFNSGTATTGVFYVLEGPAGMAATSSGVLSSTADEDTTDVFTVREGETETFTLTVTVDTNVTGQHRVSLTKVHYTDETDGVSGVGALYTPTPAQDFRTGYININAN